MKRKMIYSLLCVAILMMGCNQNEPSDRGTSISVDPNTYECTTSGAEFSVKVVSTSAWSATADQKWVEISPESGQGDAFVTITVDRGSAATANVLFSNDSGTATLKIGRGESVTPSEPSNPSTPSTEKGQLSGKFSVSDSKQVGFSQGNLQYNASSRTWRFADNQYDKIGSGNAYISSSFTGYIDLFGWGTGNNPTNVSADNSDYSTFTDWGTKSISNGGNKANKWRTLTSEEWNYLFDTRTNAANLRGQATVNNVHGYVFLADGFVAPTGLSFTANPDSWTTNVYTAAEWAKMEAVGAVFLPAAGQRIRTRVDDVADYGYYWSATPSSSAKNYAYCLTFASRSANPDMTKMRYVGISVRLVQDCK